MNKLILSTLLLAFCHATAQAQIPTEGVAYFLPKTVLRFVLLIEKIIFTPGEYVRYSERFTKTPVNDQPTTTYHIVATQMDAYVVPGSAKQSTATIDKKHSIVSVSRDQDRVIMAANDKPRAAGSQPAFKPVHKPSPIDPAKYMTAEMLAAGSSAKAAELITQDIYDIRDSKNQLSRDEAEFTSKDGEQLKIMLSNLNVQEKVMLRFFQGTAIVDTMQVFVDFVPTKEVDKALLFRFSKHLGVVDQDDLGGAPYYTSIQDEQVIPTLKMPVEMKKKDKRDVGINVNLPGKIKITLYKEERPAATFETYAAQFGRVENLSGELWDKKFITHIVPNPVTGNAERLETEAFD